MTQEEWVALTANTVEQRDLQIRQVSNGYEFTGNRRFLDADTLTEKFSIGIQGVAVSNDDALKCIENFYAGGKF